MLNENLPAESSKNLTLTDSLSETKAQGQSLGGVITKRNGEWRVYITPKILSEQLTLMQGIKVAFKIPTVYKGN